jgi:CRP/FNR family transcriptional regulator, cyclic AMP receptor protein
MAKASSDQLANVPLFAALRKQELQEVLRAADQIDAEPGQELITEGRVGHEFFLILEGEAKVVKGGKEIQSLGQGDYFGELALLDQGPRSATVVATTPMKLLVVGQREFAGLLQNIPGLAAKLLPGLARRLREVDASVFH